MAPSTTTGGRIGVADALREVDAADAVAFGGHRADLGLDGARGEIAEGRANDELCLWGRRKRGHRATSYCGR